MSGSAVLKDDDLPKAGELFLQERILDCLHDGVLLIRSDRSIAYANPAFARLWRVPADLLQYKNDFALLNHVLSQLVDPARFIGEVERLYSLDDTSEDELEFKDGRVFCRRSVPVAEGEGKLARVWLFSDISQDKGRYGQVAPAGHAAEPEGNGGLLRTILRMLGK